MGALFGKKPVERVRTVEDLRTVIQAVLNKSYCLTRYNKHDIAVLLANSDEIICKKSLEVVEQELTCGICMGLLKQACSLRCGHIFCRKCIQRWKSSKTFCTATCPICRTWFHRFTPYSQIDAIFSLVIEHSEIYKQQKLQEMHDIARRAYRLRRFDLMDSLGHPVVRVLIGPIRLIRGMYKDRIVFSIANIEEYIRSH